MAAARSLHMVLTVNAAWNIWNFRKPLVQALLDDGHRVTVLAPHDETVPLLEGLGCTFVPLEMERKGLNPLSDLVLMRRFRNHFGELAPDLVLSFTIKNNLFGAMAARSAKIAFIPNVTGLGTAFLGGRWLQAVAEKLYRTAFRRLPLVFFQNADDRDLFVRRKLVKPAQASLLPGSGIDLEQFAEAPFPCAGGPTRFLMIARLIRDKGVFEYIEAARKLRTEGVAAEFHLLGPLGAENRTAIDAGQLREWQAEGIIEYHGTTEDVRPFITDAHCVVLPSYREGAPRTLIEGAALGRPAVASDVTGCNSVVEEGVTGLLCNVRDALDLAEKLRDFAALTREAQAAMGGAARSRMEREFSVDVVIQAYRDAIDTLGV